MGGETFLVARDEAREIMGVPAPLTRVPGSREWIRGLANVRGQLLPVIDLKQYLGSGAAQPGRNTRVIVVNHREIPAGLIVDEVLGFRRFNEQDFHGEPPPTIIRCERYLAGSFRRGTEAWPVFSLKRLVESPAFLQGST
jgi:twitching motility protein PilI